MELDSVRALKAEVAERVVQPILEYGIASGSFGIPAMPMAYATGAVRGVALGIAKAGKDEYQLAVRVQRRALGGNSELVSQIRERARGEVDVRYVGLIFAQNVPWHRSRQRPLLIGGSVAHFDVTAGTIGAFVHQEGEAGVFVLSNNHVLAAEDAGRRGDAVLQPGPIDGGVDPGGRIGTLHDSITMNAAHNLVDAAISRLADGIDFDATTLRGIGHLNGLSTGTLLPGTAVMKVGRTTGFSRGIVTATELDDVVVGYERGGLSFDRQIEIEGSGDMAFSAGGDSGSLIVDADHEAVGLLFAGGDQGGSNGKGLTYANTLSEVFSALKLTLAT